MNVKLLLVDDHAVVRSGLRMLLEDQGGVTIVGEAGTAREAIEAANRLNPDVVLMDIGLPDLSGIDAAREMKRLRPDTAIVALTIHEDAEYFFKMLEAGATGYVPKRAAPDELLSAIEAAANGEVYLYPSMAKLLVGDYLKQEQATKTARALDGLTEREQEVLTQLAEGESNQGIADRLGISPKTVGRHRENLMRKLNLHSRAELVKYAIRKGIIQV
ncbi:MAG TPA: response regulator transcription factor [Anaerolineales bacterium]|nr:response regulator transcription factor [Anaerolineales bacterium]